MSYITNIDTLSALLDRLISENIKLHFFKKDGINENIKEPIVPDIVLFGLILVNFLPPILLPTTYPPISVKIHISKIKIIDVKLILYISYAV